MIPRVFVPNVEYQRFFEAKFNPPSILSDVDEEKFGIEFSRNLDELVSQLKLFGNYYGDTDLDDADFDVNWQHNGSRWFNVRLFTTKLLDETDLLKRLTEFQHSLETDYAIWVDCDYCNLPEDDEDAPIVDVIILRDRIITNICPEEFAQETISQFSFSEASYRDVANADCAKRIE